jgi:hypothetical protein
MSTALVCKKQINERFRIIATVHDADQAVVFFSKGCPTLNAL